MKTYQLISLLAAHLSPVDPHEVTKRFGWALSAGGMFATLAVVAGYGVRPDLGDMLLTPLFWMKIAFPLSLATAAIAATVRLARPGVVVGSAWAALAIPPASVWVAALAMLALAPTEAQASLVLGSTWRSCPFSIAVLSVPGFVALFSTMRGLAPTRLRLAGAMSGLLSASVATIAYCLHCPEMEIPFWAIWYLLGMAIPTAVGAVLGPRLLRW
ncbi:DUF1109 domain-containing protein [Paraburkholderia caribensis]|uniref:DUF1109 domain-containing protein n=1 Tax=Paraburkholderia TaxID=1822464 RepID=UPI001CB343FF|nr:DUF1109 domain-containing protein [Paraburkholderia caribensis]BEU25755.1 DUF1109 domain-containing protein [Paraburkholderia sp. 22B1P]CAG9242823.1 putative anti-sigma-F factor NrsF [Paraburkholderia caribensis]